MCIKLGELALSGASSKGPWGKLQVIFVFAIAQWVVFCNSFLVKGPIDMRPVTINRGGQWTFSQPLFTPTGRKGNCMSKINLLFVITFYIRETET